MEHLQIWGSFALGAAAVVYAGMSLSRYADILAEKLKLGHGFVGVILLGWATSLPELVISGGAASMEMGADLAAGNILGSCVFNLAVIALLDAISGRKALTGKLSTGLLLAAAASGMMIALAGGGLAFARDENLSQLLPGWGRISLVTLIIFGVYMVSTWLLYLHDQKGQAMLTGVPEAVDAPVEAKFAHLSLGGVIVKTLLSALVIVVAGIFLARLGDQISVTYGLGRSFVGGLFLAIITSLPEVVTCTAAVRLGLHDMAVGSLFGSNVFNIMILGVCDVIHSQGPLFALAASTNLVLGLAALLMTWIAVAGIIFRTEKTYFGIGPDSIALIGLWLGGMYVTYAGSAGT